MLRRAVPKRLIYRAIRPFSETNQQKESAVPTYDRAEFEPFKFKYERENLHYGYTLQELYGKRYGFKHSPQIRREMAKDNIMIIIAIVAVAGFGLANRANQEIEDQAWEEYYYHDMNYYRNKEAEK